MATTSKKGGECGCDGGDVHFSVLPEGCIAHVTSLTSPRDACRLSVVSSTFHSASESDAVWERFLPPDYQDIISRSVVGSRLNFGSKKELYLHLCDHPLIIDGGKKSFSLEKRSGKKCYMLAARDMHIAWGDTPMYWEWTSHPDSRFPKVAVLRCVWWLEIRGKINTSMLSLNTHYAAYLVFKLSNGYGFDCHSVEVFFGISGCGGEMQTVYFDLDWGQIQGYHIQRRFCQRHHLQPVFRKRNAQNAKQRADGWFEIGLGEYVNEGGEDGDLEMSLMEAKHGIMKGGLVVQGIEIRPKEC